MGIRDLMRAEQTPEQRELAEWVYELTRNVTWAVVLLGMMEALATREPELTYWECLRRAREKWAS